MKQRTVQRALHTRLIGAAAAGVLVLPVALSFVAHDASGPTVSRPSVSTSVAARTITTAGSRWSTTPRTITTAGSRWSTTPRTITTASSQPVRWSGTIST